MQDIVNSKKILNDAPSSITPSGFFGSSINNIVELKDFITEAEANRLTNFAINNKIWDVTESHVDDDGLVLYDANVWKDRVCTYNSLMKSDASILDLINDMIKRLKIEVDKFFDVDAQETGPAIVRWPIGARQEPHADKEFHTGAEKGRPNDFPYYDLAGLFYFNDNYEGGELYFPQHGIEFKPKARAAYFFPGDRFYTHGVRPVKSGNRFTSPFFWTILKHTGEKQP
ncbi:Oxoglutarate/iron-dependent dioxygenase [uncultured Caudovirales phage]|uniref:Oxoglutarate/iron-dependent dioxygenase n=1 Tax=uncultured Caudovirales phage TaxID=2100421 RepID=A0A6J5QN47_9CAUD|nr:Oxoglutarate/iron-dependent dioxygenase [uncultured Caudovirales phage]CAB4151113.1 Oxoglutarate/iron-dependent dioxygenase [uncultured Caudovirales phage]CAB4173789.1 Oxoglutarate/iron-dependent dioxygenase [uncultured Caudovirales phage]CAB4179740.1 Oxoglutarate/iron-dependent dioxygenase [uncultured Caudovirales phage]CAB4185873.1 Oxoglutarate/iron-dependent dioxygenase [uncultured Caudovirales phage]